MDFGLSTEQEQLAAAERAWLQRHDPVTRLRPLIDAGPVTLDPDAVTHAAEAGLLVLLNDEIGGTHVDLALLSEEHGRAASSLPVADAAVAARLLAEAGVDVAEDQVWGVTRARGELGSPVPMAADLAGVVVIAEESGVESVSVVPQPELAPMSTLDLTRSWARPVLDGKTTQREVAAGTFARVRDALAVHRALDALGAAARLLEMTVDYAGQRKQFGSPIGSFQAVKHHCANMSLWVEAGRAVLWAAALALDTDGANRSRTASCAAAYAKSAAVDVAGTALQVHGGIGFTWEHDLHLLLRRIKVDAAMDGSVTEHRAALVA
ncbi:acyl-CoA dehydrogenase family protein [Mycolicibacterium sp. XJ1819]